MLEAIRERREQKGFTLVELIVVLVILAILAAMLVPTMTGYIDRANQDKLVAETRMIVMAAQTVASERYGQGEAIDGEYENSDSGSEDSVYDEIQELAEVSESFSVTITGSQVMEVVYPASAEVGDYQCTYTAAHEGAEAQYSCQEKK